MSDRRNLFGWAEGIGDRAETFGRGVLQGASGGWSEEAAAALLSSLPVEDNSGIAREYAGSQYEQYRDSMRRDDAEAAARHPLNYAAGNILGAAPGAAALGASIPAAVGAGALAGAGSSDRTGVGLAKDAVAGGAIGGAVGAAGRALPHVVKAAKGLLPPGGFGPQLQPAMAGAGGVGVGREARLAAAATDQLNAPQINQARWVSTDHINPAELRTGRLGSVEGASGSERIGDKFPRKYLIEAPDQGVPVNYAESGDEVFADGMKVARRTQSGSSANDSKAGLSMATDAARKLKGPFGASDLGFPTIDDAGVHSARDIADQSIAHWRGRINELKANPQAGFKFSPERLTKMEASLDALDPEALASDARKLVHGQIERYADEAEYVLPDGLNVGPGTRIRERATGQSYSPEEWLAAQDPTPVPLSIQPGEKIDWKNLPRTADSLAPTWPPPNVDVNVRIPKQRELVAKPHQRAEDGEWFGAPVAVDIPKAPRVPVIGLEDEPLKGTVRPGKKRK